MSWTDVDGVRDHLGGRDRVSRKQVYALVKAGMRVARVGDSGRRLVFSLDWVDQFLEGTARAEPAQRPESWPRKSA